jgi:hypothetical protein
MEKIIDYKKPKTGVIIDYTGRRNLKIKWSDGDVGFLRRNNFEAELFCGLRRYWREGDDRRET